MKDARTAYLTAGIFSTPIRRVRLPITIQRTTFAKRTYSSIFDWTSFETSSAVNLISGVCVVSLMTPNPRYHKRPRPAATKIGGRIYHRTGRERRICVVPTTLGCRQCDDSWPDGADFRDFPTAGVT